MVFLEIVLTILIAFLVGGFVFYYLRKKKNIR
jgi:LPXTG-motif cell wall-anchored protein